MRRNYLVLGWGARYEWPDEHMQALVTMWNSGHTASQISKALSDAGFPATRNAVIGKVHRLKLIRHKSPAKTRLYTPRVYKTSPDLRERERLRMRAKRDSAMPVVVRLPPPPPPKPWDGPCISILDDKLGRFMCREIVAGEGVGTMFCGAPTAPDSQFSYCAFHAQTNLRVVKRQDPTPRFVPYRVAA